MSHYYTPDPRAEHDYQVVDYHFMDREFSFITDANVFSRDRVDFGSNLLIQSMEINRDAHVLDVGCGYGPIGICAAWKAIDGSVTMIDVNERAVHLSNQNIRKNAIRNARAIISDTYSALPPEEKYHTILTNPPIRAGKEVVYRIFDGAYPRLLPNGSLWVVIQKKQGADSAREKLQEVFDEVIEVHREKGYKIIQAKKLIT